MRRNEVISADAAAQIALDGDTVATGGFVGVGFAVGARAGTAVRGHWLAAGPHAGPRGGPGRRRHARPEPHRSRRHGAPGHRRALGAGTGPRRARPRRPHRGGGGLGFGAVANPQATIDQQYQFDPYDGGGLDQAFLGMAEAEAEGNVDASRFGRRVTGAGGSTDISQNAEAVFFLGTFRARSRVAVRDGAPVIDDTGAIPKARDRVGQVTVSGRLAAARGQSVHHVTERCVLRLTGQGLELIEITPGVDVDRDVLAHMAVPAVVGDDLRMMDVAILRDRPMGPRDRPPIGMDERVRFDRAGDTAYVDVEGLRLVTPQDAEDPAADLDRRLAELGRRVPVVVHHDHVDLGPDAADPLLAMVRRDEERFFLSTTRCSTSAFFRRQLGREFDERDMYADSSAHRR